jgi:hypothetical protein
MTWLNGRHDNYSQSVSQYYTLRQWREEVSEKVLSSLFMTIWLANDCATDNDMDIP